MASCDKYKSTDVGGLLKHNNRQPDEKIERENECIDPSRTYQNYFLKKGSTSELSKRLSEAFSAGRIDQVVMEEIVVTLPKNVKSEDERVFFRSVFDFCCNELGENNIINAVVHKDETTPHIHIDFAPIKHEEVHFETRFKHKFEEWKKQRGIEGNVVDHLCGNEVFDREFFQTLHPKLQKYVSNELNYEVEILTGITEKEGGNKSVLTLKVNSLKEQIEILERQKDNIQQEIDFMYVGLKGAGLTVKDLQLLPLMQKILDLENQNKIYSDIVQRNNLPFSTEDITRIKNKQYIPSLSVNLNVFDVQLSNAEIAEDGIIVIELFDQKERPLPQQDYINANRDLQEKIRAASRINRMPISVKHSNVSDRNYVLIRADDERQTLLRLLELQDLLRKQRDEWKNRHIYMERMEFDTFDVARSVLEHSNYPTSFFTGRRIEEKDGREQSKTYTE